MEVINDLLTVMTLVKMGVVIIITVSLSVLAEMLSPRIAGILTGYPLGAAISLFFVGMEIEPRFAALSALHTAAGISATLVFGYCYWQVSMRVSPQRRGLQIFSACTAGLMGYFAGAWVLSMIPPSLWLALLVPALCLLVNSKLVENIKDVTIDKREKMGPVLLLVRALIAAVTIVVIVSTAKLVGPTWAGLFSSFPNIMLPLVVIIHSTYSPEHAYVIIKNVPKGLASVVLYCFTVSLSYPEAGVYAGTVMAYLVATVYLVITQFRKELFQRQPRGTI